MNPHNRTILVVIVHFGSENKTKSLIGQLKSQPTPCTIVVVNNGPGVFREDGVEVLQATSNHGYAGAILLALGFAAGKKLSDNTLVVFMNNDVEVVGDIIAYAQAGRG